MAMRTATSAPLPACRCPLPASGSQLSSEAKIEPQHRTIQRMVLRVEGQMARPVQAPARLRPRSTRASAKMRHRRDGGEQHLAPQVSDGVAEVDVLGVEEESLVEQAGGLRVSPPDQQARAGDPVDELFARGL